MEGGRGLRIRERVVNKIKVDYNSSKMYIVVNFCGMYTVGSN